MIFCFSESFSAEIDLSLEATDIYCFFHSQKAVHIPEEFWLKAVISSLKLKKNVLILKAPLVERPVLNLTARWQVAENFLWLAPRSLSVLLEAAIERSMTYDLLKTRLTNSK